ncbi:CBS domain-containing protein [Kitasatospora sp. NPDC087271]|uniref:CBS domain-containing protein n=1 Tax=Kitasatospora sp. NPDC087271 TaxID=3364067 RepID=UPI003822EA18
MADIFPDREQVAGLKGKECTVLELLDFFGVRVRHPGEIAKIDHALLDAGLATLPYFGNTPRDERVRIVIASVETAPDGSSSSGSKGDGSDGELPMGVMPTDPLLLRSVPSARGGLVSVRTDNTLQHAISLMMQRDFSQLPVIDNVYTLVGVVTWDSIARMYATSVQHDLKRAMVETGPVAEINTPLPTALPLIEKEGYCLVRDSRGQLQGIVTASDIAIQFEQLSRPFFTIGQIERCLRERLGPVFTPQEIQEAGARYQGKPSQSIEHLMFSGYAKLIKDPEGWKRMNWHGIDHDEFVHHLRKTGHIRNEVMHFDRTLDAASYDALTRFAEVLASIPRQNYGD